MNALILLCGPDCDESLLKTFKGECDFNATFLIKVRRVVLSFQSPPSPSSTTNLSRAQTHFPAIPRRYDPSTAPNYFRRFDQAVLIVRNPLDSIASWWHLIHAPRTNGIINHEGKGMSRSPTRPVQQANVRVSEQSSFPVASSARVSSAPCWISPTVGCGTPNTGRRYLFGCTL
jgi:hypothetical protein